MKKAIELLERAKLNLIEFSRGMATNTMFTLSDIEEALAELKTPPRWETPEQWEKRTGAIYPDKAPVWSVSKYEITGYNRLRWYLGIYGEVKDSKSEMVFCAYDHLGPPPDIVVL